MANFFDFEEINDLTEVKRMRILDDFPGNRKRNRGRCGNGGRGNRNYSPQLDNDAGNFGHEKPKTSLVPGHQSEWQQQRGWSNQNFSQKLRKLAEPTLELEPIETKDVKFSGHSRLCIGNLPAGTDENALREIFKPYGEIDDIFSSFEKNITFLRVDYFENAVKAKRALDGSMRNGRQLRVSLAPKATTLRVSNLNGFVSNELLYKSFEIFGPIERALVKVDDRGRSMGEGFVDFAKKSSAKMCLRMCREKSFFLTASLYPCLVEPMDIVDQTEGLSETFLNKKLPDFLKERSIGPRFAEVYSFEHKFGAQWKLLHNVYKSKQEELKRKLRIEEQKLAARMEYIRTDFETKHLREKLRQRELKRDRLRLYWEMQEHRANEENDPLAPPTHYQQLEDIDYDNDYENRIMRQGNDMQRYQQESNSDEFYNTSPFAVFGKVSSPQQDLNETNENLNERMSSGYLKDNF